LEAALLDVGLEVPASDADIAGPRDDPGDEADAVSHASTRTSRVDEQTYPVSPLVLPYDTGRAGPGHMTGVGLCCVGPAAFGDGP
jgi:hypothetical protein